jgi:hypothetical protein
VTHHSAISLSPVIAHDVTFVITATDFEISDVLDIHLSSGGTVPAVIERFDMSGLQLNIDGDVYSCRPWKMGDRAVRRDIGVTSNWTIQ